MSKNNIDKYLLNKIKIFFTQKELNYLKLMTLESINSYEKDLFRNSKKKDVSYYVLEFNYLMAFQKLLKIIENAILNNNNYIEITSNEARYLIASCNQGHYVFDDDENFIDDVFVPIYSRLGDIEKRVDVDIYKDAVGKPREVSILRLRLLYANSIKPQKQNISELLYS